MTTIPFPAKAVFARPEVAIPSELNIADMTSSSSTAGRFQAAPLVAEGPVGLMESLAIGTGFDIACVQFGLTPPEETQSETPTDIPLPVSTDAITSASDPSLYAGSGCDGLDQSWWWFAIYG